MPTKFKVKRSTVSSVTPTTGDIDTGELAINLPDRKLFTSNGSAVYELGSNQTNLSVSANLTIGASGDLVFTPGAGIYANGSLGTAGFVLHSNATSVYWAAASGTGTVTSVATGNGLTGGPITTTGTISVLANNGIVANTTGVYVNANTGLVANVTGVYVNSTYIGTLSANNTTYLNGQLAAYYTNATNITTGTLPWAQAPTGTVNTSSTFTFSGIQTYNANVVIGSTGELVFNTAAGIYANGSLGTAGQVLTSNATTVYWSTPATGTVTSVATGNGLTGGTITGTGTISVVANSGIVANSTGTFVNANNGITANSTGVFVRANTGLVANATGVYVNSTYIGTLSANNASFLGGTAAASYVQNTDSRTLSGNLVFTGANVLLQSASLGGTATNFVNNFIINTNVGNASYLRFYHSRHTTGADWTGASTRIQQRIDVTDMGYLEFNPSGYAQGIALYGTSGSGLVVSQTGNVVTSTNTFTVGTASYFVSNGNVGIGTSSPAAKLDVNGGIVSRAVASEGGEIQLNNPDNLAAGLVVDVSAADSGRIFNTRNNSQITIGQLTGTGGIITLYTEASERVRVAANGNVGVGTSSPGSALHAYGNGAEIRAENTTTSQYASSRLRLKGPAGTARSSVLVHGNDNVGGTNPYFAIEGHNSSETYIKSMALFYHASDYWYFPYTIRSPIFYDSDDTNSYFEGPQLFMRGSAPTVYFRDTNHNSAMIHCNSNLLYFLRGGNDTTSWTQVNSQWPLYLNLTNNDAILGGSFNAVGNITAYYSDRRLKTNIKPITGAIDKLKQINGVYYKNNDFAKSVGYTDEDEQVGVISQEVEKVLPHVVKRAPFDIEYDETDRTKIKSKSGEDYKTVQYDRLVPLLIEAIKEQQVEIEKLKAAIAKEV